MFLLHLEAHYSLISFIVEEFVFTLKRTKNKTPSHDSSDILFLGSFFSYFKSLFLQECLDQDQDQSSWSKTPSASEDSNG